MKLRLTLIATLLLLGSSISMLAAGKYTNELVESAVSTDTDEAAAAIKQLRTMGQTGLDALFVKFRSEIDHFAKTGEVSPDWLRVANAIDTVGMQKDEYAAQLYWYTDLNAAKGEAARRNKPILSLRLLGNLNEEFSCANSRLFRAILYPNAAISKYLRENYILHWQSVRPAPRITIDFGDGRKIERTITGNSIHYILDKNGDVIDALPGLYTPEMFLSYLTRANELVRSIGTMDAKARMTALLKYRADNFARIKRERDAAIAKAGVEMTETRSGTLAILAAPMAVAKMVVVDEYSILRVYDDFAKFEPSIKFDDWGKLAAIYAPSAAIDGNSVAFIRRQNARTGLTEAEFRSMFAKVESFVALDSTRNDFIFHTKLYEWLNRGRGVELESLNAQVYDQLFKTPNTDKWLGLYSNDVYTALDGNGIIK